MNNILSQNTVEDKRCEMKKEILSLVISLYFLYSSPSAIGSSAAVGSSKISTGAFLYID